MPDETPVEIHPTPDDEAHPPQLQRACPSTCTRPLQQPADGVCPGCGRPWAEAA